MKLFQLVLLIVLYWLNFTAVRAQQPFSPESSDEFSSFVNQQMKLDQIPGLTVGFQYKGNKWVKGFGYADVENNVKATRNSSYRLASNTKSMTSVAVLNLYEENKLNLDEPVRKYVPYFPRKEWPISIRHLMGHLGGISHYKNYEVEGHIKEPKDTRESLEIFDDFQLVAKPGTEYHYTSYGYNLLGAVIEGAAHDPYKEYLRNHIWEPLDMTNTHMDDPEKIISNRVQGYQLKFGELFNSEFVDISSRFASGGVISTVPDLLKYAEGLNSARILSRSTIDMMESSMSTIDGKYTDYGMGWRIQPVNGHFMVYHTGGQPETRTILMRFPEIKLNIACAYNLEGGNLYAFPRRLYQMLTGESWNVKPFAVNKVEKELYDGMWDVYNYGLAYYEKHQKAMPVKEGEFEKIMVFINNTLNPDSINKNFEEAKARINLGRHPKAKMAYVKYGSYMAAKLAENYGADQLDQYHKNGAIPFFADFIELNRSLANHSVQINKGLQDFVSGIEADWDHCWNQDTRRMWFAPDNELNDQLEKIIQLFQGRNAYPDFTKEIARSIWKGALQSNPGDYVPLAKKFAALYPESAIPHLIIANVNVLANNKRQASRALDEAMRAEMDRYILSASRLNAYAQQIYRANFLDKALDYIEVTEKYHPGSGLFEVARGKIYREKSKRSYKKALELDPTLDDAWEELQEIE